MRCIIVVSLLIAPKVGKRWFKRLTVDIDRFATVRTAGKVVSETCPKYIISDKGHCGQAHTFRTYC